MTIKEVCEKAGITADTLRYYEKAGVIPNVARSCGGTRCYSEEDLQWIQTAVCLRNAGMSVVAIAQYVNLFKQGEETVEERLNLLQSERDRILEQKKQLEEALHFIDYKINLYEDAIKNGTDVGKTPCQAEDIANG